MGFIFLSIYRSCVLILLCLILLDFHMDYMDVDMDNILGTLENLTNLINSLIHMV